MNDTLDIGGGAGGRSFPWGPQGTQPGARVAGRVLALAEVQATHFDGPLKGQPETWDNGDPKMQYRVTLQTDLRDPADEHDDGIRDVYLDGSRKQRDNGTKSRLCAVLDAVRAATGSTALAVGGYLEVVWVNGMGFSGDPRNFEARYQPPALDLGTQAPVTQATGANLQPGPVAPVQATQPDPWAAPTAGDPWAVNGSSGQPSATASQAQPAPPLPFTPGHAAQVAAEQAGPQYVNRATGEIATPEQVAAIIAAGMDPAAVFATA